MSGNTSFQLSGFMSPQGLKFALRLADIKAGLANQLLCNYLIRPEEDKSQQKWLGVVGGVTHNVIGTKNQEFKTVLCCYITIA